MIKHSFIKEAQKNQILHILQSHLIILIAHHNNNVNIVWFIYKYPANNEHN